MSPSRPPAEIQSNSKCCPWIHPRSARTLVRVSGVRTPKMLSGGQGSITRSLPTRRGCWATTCVTDINPKTRLAQTRRHALLMRLPERHLSITVSENDSSRRLVCRERSIVRGDGGRFTTPPPLRLEARSRLGDKAANEVGPPLVSSIPAQLPGLEPASSRSP